VIESLTTGVDSALRWLYAAKHAHSGRLATLRLPHAAPAVQGKALLCRQAQRSLLRRASSGTVLFPGKPPWFHGRGWSRCFHDQLCGKIAAREEALANESRPACRAGSVLSGGRPVFAACPAAALAIPQEACCLAMRRGAAKRGGFIPTAAKTVAFAEANADSRCCRAPGRAPVPVVSMQG